MRTILLMAALGCGSTPAPAPAPADGPGDLQTCIASRDTALDRQCNVAADCTIVESEDCCGPIDIAVHVGTESSFASVEAAFDRCLACPPLGCAHQTEAEDGMPATSGHTIVTACVSARCTTAVQ
jgi:hypothetical protein